MRNRILVVLLFLSISSLYGQGRITKFSTDSLTFFDEVELFMINSRKDEGRSIMGEFSWSWFGGMYSEKQREDVYRVANLMLKKRKKAFPDFKNYLNTVSLFINNQYQTEESFTSWHSILEKLIKGKSNKRFTTYLKACNTLFEENLLYKSKANSWASNNINYTFGYDSLPTIEFESLTLTCYSKGDSSVIKNTKGIYYPTIARWVGTGGKITWERTGLSADSVYADINSYEILLKSPKYEAKDVFLYDYRYFKESIKGILQEKVLAKTKSRKVSYPRFDSYDGRIEIPNISKGVDYVGGFSLRGASVIGKSTDGIKANIVFKKQEKPFLKVESESFVFNSDKILSKIAAITFYLKNDSIYHPGLSFKFFVKDRRVNLIRDHKGIKLTPYFNSYHELDMDFESLNWAVDSPTIEFSNLRGGTKTDAVFISSNYFRLDAYMGMMAMGNEHPLHTIKKIVKKLDTTYVKMTDLAQYMRLSFTQLETMLLDLSNKGFIIYKYEEKAFIVKDKLIDWVDASGGNIDYDVIGFYSKIKGANNGTLSLLNYDLKLRGVNSINVSDSQQVIIYPAKQEIILKKNRDFLFSGVVQAGRFDVMGKNFSFKYDEFRIDMPTVDSLRIYAETTNLDKYGKPVLRPVKTVIEKISGDLLIDNPDNKSGIKAYSNYPIFNSVADAYVFYNRKSIQGGVYKKDDFYFHVEPFQIDSLDNFNNDALMFEGTMVSAGIFPNFEETLLLQPDHSLGFVRKTPTEGFPMYGGKGIFTNDIKMSHKGLRGDGKLDYLTSTTYSNDFLFFPDSMNTIAQKYIVKAKADEVKFPAVEGNNVKNIWYPKEDLMIHEEIDQPIAMYDMNSFMHGSMMLRPSGLTGGGMFEFENAELSTNLIKFSYEDFESDTADFRLKDKILKDALMFETVNLKTFISFKERYGEFKLNAGASHVKFPQNQYICYMEEFRWYMDQEGIDMKGAKKEVDLADSELKLEGSQFISVHPDQDSLDFYAIRGKYDLRKKIIYADGIKFLALADAAIFPDSGKVVIEKKARMRQLNNARVTASSINQYHNMYNASINVFGKKKYEGTAYIDYIDELDKSQTLYLHTLGVDSSGQTYGLSNIADTANFTLSAAFQFYGNVELYANNEFLTFEGSSRISHDCDLLEKDWFNFRGEINPKEIYIPIGNKMKSVNNKPLLSSILLSPDSLGIYSSFLNEKNKKSDIEVLRSSGFLNYDKALEEYRVSNQSKLKEKSFTGNYISLNTKTCKIYGEGGINLGGDLGQVDLSTLGTVQHNQLNNDVVFDLVMLVDFFFSDDALKKMTKKFQEATSLDPTKLDRLTFEKSMRELLGKEEGDKLIAQVNLYGEFKKIPDIMKKKMVFNDVKLKWDVESNSYKSYSKIGLSNIGNKQINKYVDGKIELIKKRSGDVLTIYLEVDRNNWYFFTYTRGVMQAISSDVDFNSIIQEVKPDKRKSKTNKEKGLYQYMYSSKNKRKDFLRKFDE